MYPKVLLVHIESEIRANEYSLCTAESREISTFQQPSYSIARHPKGMWHTYERKTVFKKNVDQSSDSPPIMNVHLLVARLEL